MEEESYVESYHELDHNELRSVRYKPESLDALCRMTKFTRKELQIMYRGFKQESPTGIVNEEKFKTIYAQFFPLGDSSAYAHFVFNTFDRNHSGTLSFEDFVVGLSVLVRGTFHDQLQWAFRLYDTNSDGIITKDELLDIVAAVYDMMGKYSHPSINQSTILDHVDRVFRKMDHNRDGVISVDDFVDTCENDEVIRASMAVFDTAL